jgi:hypothetical protein
VVEMAEHAHYKATHAGLLPSTRFTSTQRVLWTSSHVQINIPFSISQDILKSRPNPSQKCSKAKNAMLHAIIFSSNLLIIAHKIFLTNSTSITHTSKNPSTFIQCIGGIQFCDAALIHDADAIVIDDSLQAMRDT